MGGLSCSGWVCSGRRMSPAGISRLWFSIIDRAAGPGPLCTPAHGMTGADAEIKGVLIGVAKTGSALPHTRAHTRTRQARHALLYLDGNCLTSLKTKPHFAGSGLKKAV
jgi:hypothetical protein